jgi:hypothetical protein
MSPFLGNSCNVDERPSTRSSRTAPLGRVSMECSEKGGLKMKTKLFCSLLLLAAAVAPVGLAAADGSDRNLHTGKGQLLVTPVDDSAVRMCYQVPP